MKAKLSNLVLIFTLFITPNYSKAQGFWKVQNPLPTSEVLYDVYSLPNSEISWAVGAGGCIIKSVNGGNTWTNLNSGTYFSLKGVRFFDANTGWVAGDSGTILKTTNGGTTWTRRTSGTSLNLRDLHFIDKNSVWALGDIYNQSSVIIKTIDGGDTWTSQSFPTTDLFDIFFIDANNGWAVGRLGAMLNTINGGATWIAKTSGTTNDLFSVFFINSSIGWACGFHGKIIKTVDGGSNWFPQSSGFPLENLTSIYFVDANTGWFNIDDQIAKTIDGGTNWIVQFNNSSVSFNRLWFSNATSGIAVGRGGIYKTNNGGSAWTSSTIGTFITLERLCFVDANTGYAAGGIYNGRGGVVKTSDGGNKWTILIENYAYYLRAVKFINSDIGWVVGDHGTILKTINGGTTWTAQTSNTTNRLNSVFFLNESVGWVAGYYGTLLKTTNGGSTWTPISIGASDQYFVYFLNPDTGWISGNGTIKKTTNGGTTWTNQTISTSTNIYNLRFLDANNGWTCTQDGKIFKTSNGGSTWTAVATFSSEYFYDIVFTDINNGWVVGGDFSRGGSIRKTIDGGVTWTLENSHTANSLNSVGFVGKTMGWTSGAQGVILHYTDYSPATQASNLIKSNSTFQSVNVSWTRGNGNQCALFVKQASTGTCTPDVNVTYLPNATFGQGDQVGSTGWYCAYNGAGTSVSVSGFQANTSYRFQVCEYNFSPDFTHYISTTATNNPITATTAIAPPSIAGNPSASTMCETLGTSFSVTASGSSLGYQWQADAGGGYLNVANNTVYSGATTATLSLTSIPASLNGDKYHCIVTNTSGSATSGEALLTVNPLPVSAGDITGDQIVCRNTSYTYIVPIISYATSYEWTFPTGFSGSSTTNSINLAASSNSVAGIISVNGKNSCGSGPVKNFNVNVRNLPANALPITGSVKICTNSINIGYNTSVIADADYYIWSLPLGATGTSSINSIMVSYGATPLSDQITVKGHNMCGNGVPAILPVTVSNVPALSGSITGLSNVCKNQTDVLYSINASPDATSYLWTLPPGVTGSNSTDSVFLSFGPDAISGDLRVSGVNSCGTGPYITFPVVFDEVPEPAGYISGLATVCRGQSNVLYTIEPSSRATYYIWDLPDGSSETTVTNKIVLNLNNNASSGTLYVTPFNSCGAGNGNSLFIKVPSPIKPTIDDSNYFKGMCLGESPVRLSVKDIIPGYGYNWYKNDIPFGNSTFIEVIEEANYYLEANLDNCSSERDTLPIDFIGTQSKPDIYANGPIVWYLSTNSTAKYYRWYYNGSHLTQADNNKVYVAGQNLGIYRVSISDDNKCFVFSDTIRIPKSTVGIEDTNPFEEVKIYPNPTTGMFTIEMDNNIFGELIIDIFTQNGSKTLNIKFEKTTEHFSSQIDLSGQSKGMYLISLAIDKYKATRKILVE